MSSKSQQKSHLFLSDLNNGHSKPFYCPDRWVQNDKQNFDVLFWKWVKMKLQFWIHFTEVKIKRTQTIENR